MKKILTIMWKDVSILFLDRTALLLIIAGPLLLTVGMGLVTGSYNRGDNVPAISRIPLIIVDQDGGALAASLVDLLTGDDLSELLAPQLGNDETAAQEQVRQGDAAAAVIIPAGFSAALTPDPATGALPDAVALRVYGDPGSPIGAGVVRSIVDEFTSRVQTGVTTVQVALSVLAAGGAVAPAELPAIGQSLGEGLSADDGAATATGSVIQLRSETTATSGEESFNMLSYFAPAMALLFLMYAVTLGARTLLSERREGTLARMLAAPVTNGQVLSGKIAGIFFGGFLQLAILIVLSVMLFQLNWGNPLAVLLLVVAAALAATGWGVLIASAAANSGQVSAIGMAVTLLFGILGGSFIPNQNMGAAFEWAGRITPNKWAMDGFLSLATGDGLAEIVTPVAALLVMAVVLFAVSAALFRRRQSDMLSG
ncbi:MAG: ABC transporter permease [Candidatus Promineofilum sp.]|nr:ABC transporter permease [Promineifilum sp.]